MYENLLIIGCYNLELSSFMNKYKIYYYLSSKKNSQNITSDKLISNYDDIFKIKPKVIIYNLKLDIEYCETKISEFIDTNILFLKKLLNDISINDLSIKFIFLSSINSINPYSNYEIGFNLSEKLILEHSFIPSNKNIFIILRIPYVINQGKFLYIDDSYSKFVITNSQYNDIITNSILYGKNLEIWTPDCFSFKISDIIKYGEINYSVSSLKNEIIEIGEKIEIKDNIYYIISGDKNNYKLLSSKTVVEESNNNSSETLEVLESGKKFVKLNNIAVYLERIQQH